MTIRNFSCRITQQFFYDGGTHSKVGWSSVQSVARRKLMMIHYAHQASDLIFPPGNRLEKLKGDWAGYYSIRINNQWRVVFQWQDNAAENVEIVDYH